MDILKDVLKYVKKKYGVEPEYPLSRAPSYSVLRHEDSRRRFAQITYAQSDASGGDVISVRLKDPLYIDMLVQQEGYSRCRDIGRGDWISVLLDGTVPLRDVCGLIDESFLLTASSKKKRENRPPKEWIVPANPKYYDVEHAFDGVKEIDWKQGNGIKAGDTVYMYVAAPVSAILYKCRVTETDIPFSFVGKDVTISALMTIKLLRRYEPDRFTFDVLKNEHGIFAVRGPRGVPRSLSEALER